ncbi:MAG: nucleoside monophosphate kinase [Patescibacteria group bacterium]|nr:nucleoside monophosphate kinase [Patescibacteria group bacterium]MDD5715355.1 nucleoside monophosphate kinase [Patescibacteria group bacterium]
MKKKIIIILVGLSSSGKDTAAAYLGRKGFAHFSLSETLRAICRRRHIEVNRDNLIRVGNELRTRFGVGYLAEKTLLSPGCRRVSRLIISSVRNPGEIAALKRHGMVFVIAVSAPQRMRYLRAKRRGRIDDHVSYARFQAQERKERTGSATQQQLDVVIAAADFHIPNNDSVPKLYRRIDNVLAEIHRRVRMSMNTNYILLGPQGSGKGTQAHLLAERFRLYHVETGKILRKLARQQSPLGRRVHRIINIEGKLAPDPIVLKVLQQELSRVAVSRGFLFDGFPRTIAQARSLDRVMASLHRAISWVIFLPIRRSTTIRRLSLRRTCDRCGAIFIDGVDIERGREHCPRCTGLLVRREDDKPQAINRRLVSYNRLTKPVIAYYRRQGILLEVNGEPSIAVVFRDIIKALAS